MGTRVHNNYEDLITFTRASGGHALRPVSYGSELVTNGDGGSITDWSAARTNSTVSVNNGRLRSTAIASGAHGIAQTLSNLTVGAIYFYSANVYADGGSGNMIFRVSALSTLDNQPVSDEQSTTRLVSGSFVATASTMYVGGIHVAAAGGDYIELDNVSIKEVTFDESDGTLTLFEHPDNVPRVEYDADGNRLGLLIEEARTNLITNSDFDAGVSQSGVTITANASESPDGLENATSLDITTTGAFAYFTVPVTAGTEYTWSWFAKAGTATAHVYAVYDITNAAFVSREQYTLTNGENYGRGWYRHSETFTAPSGCTEVRVYAVRATDDSGYVSGATGTTFVWGGQLEAASFATSIIRTTGTTATRSADVASIPVTDFGFNPKAMSMLIEWQTIIPDPVSWDGYNRIVSFGESSGSELIEILGTQNTSNVYGAVYAGGSQQLAYIQFATDGSPEKTAFRAGTNTWRIADNGTLLTEDTSVTMPTKIDRLGIGIVGTTLSGNEINGYIKSIKYYPRRLTNAQLQDITS